MIYAKGTIVDMGDIYQMVIEECPLCHGRHYHGAGDKSINQKDLINAEGNRVAHCLHQNIPKGVIDEYYIIWDKRIIKHNQLKKEDKRFMKRLVKIEKERAFK